MHACLRRPTRRPAPTRSRGPARRPTVAVLTAALVALVPLAAGCGGATAADKSAIAPQKADPKLRALLPERIRKAGTLRSAAGSDYPPLVMLGMDNKTLVGVEPDLMNAIGQVLGLKVEFSKASFESIIGGVQARRYDVAIQAMLDKPERQRQVTFVDYFRTSTSILVDGRDAGKVSSLDDLCGKSAAVEQGTAQVDDAKTQSKKCLAAGRPRVEGLVFPNSMACFQALSTGRADAFIGGTPTVAYQAEQSSGRMKRVGKPYRPLPYGILVGKDDKALVEAVQGALQKLIDTGVYRTILKHWKVQSGALDRAAVNGGTA
ncbi:ABC transporter substrate-binding protein [Streptomyces sp. NPDC006422]|uniref:ABC transporter substrate-binding protein n=1 Tax=unclassified Streptomyces TaxID=2593676 RepID=UPI0033A2DF0E